MKTAFHLPSVVNEDFIRNLLWQHQEQHHQKSNTNQQQQSIKQFISEGVSKYTLQLSIINYLRWKHEDFELSQ